MLKQIAIYTRYFFYAKYRNILTVIMQIIAPVSLMIFANNEGTLDGYIRFITYFSSMAALFGVIEFLVIRKEKYLIQYHTIVKSPLVFLFSKINIELFILFQIQVIYFLFIKCTDTHNLITFNNWLIVLISSVIITIIITFYLSFLITLEIGPSKIDSIRNFGSIIIFIISFSGESLPKMLMQLNPINQINHFVSLNATKLQFDINIYMIMMIIIGVIIFIYSIYNVKVDVKE
ncbi:hypothetical protein HZY91_04800 [Facklamia sp. DSM 111018]|uniref:ABC transporter permease n=1 Tax=Facklamia lactis TaxID=2749967 RepID=A0ABS0LPY8_9LACT|nr:hypothetical protein [Facklamia lactis]MBG9986212.1 hypothetical protein [Facklamia lactis]